MIQSAQKQSDTSNAPEELVELRDRAIAAQSDARTARQWDRARQLYQGNFYSDVEMAEWKSKGSNPKLWEVVQRFTPILTDSLPKFKPKPRGVEDELMNRILQVGIDYEWERQNMQRKIAMMAKQGLIFGNSFLYTGVDPHPQGNILYTKVKTPYQVFPDSEATSDDDLAYCWFKSNARASDLVKNYGPKVATKIVKEGAPTSGGERPRFRDMPRRDVIGGVDAAMTEAGDLSGQDILGPQSRGGFRGSNEHYEVWEGYFTDYGVSEIPAIVDGEDAQFTLKNFGRRVIMVGDNYIPALDNESIFKHEQIPISRFCVDDLPDDFWSGSYIIPLADRAEQIADLDNQVLNSVHLMLGAVWLIPTQSGIKQGSIYQYPSMQIPYNAPHKPEVIAMPPLPQFVHTLRNEWQKEFNDASGISDVSRGNFSGSLDDVSGKAVQLLQQPTFTRMRLIQRNMEETISRWGYQTACNLAQFWTLPMWLRILPQDLQQAVLAAGAMPWDAEENAELPFSWLLPDIVMETGSSLPEDRQAKLAATLNLLDRRMLGTDAQGNPGGPLAVDAVLSQADFPNREAFVQLAAQKDAQMAQQMAMQQAMAQQAPPDAPQQDKSLGGVRSPESETAVGADLEGQEVPA